MAKAVDLTNQRFGLWTVIERFNVKAPHAFWRCVCDCGNEAIVRGSSLRQGRSLSCGCTREAKRIKAITKHGGYGTRLYRIWDDMKARCKNPNSISYRYYGAKGISVCPEWSDFKTFHDWALRNGYADDLTIDRIDNSKGYSPENCRWVDILTQENNKSSNHFISYKGETMSISQWARRFKLSYPMLLQRVLHGWDFEKAISTPSLN